MSELNNLIVPDAGKLASETNSASDELVTAQELQPISSGNVSNKLIPLKAIHDVPVTISAVLGKKKIDVASLLKMEQGAVIDIDRKVGEAIDLYVNDTLVARGELILVDGSLGVSMTEIIHNDAHNVSGTSADKNL